MTVNNNSLKVAKKKAIDISKYNKFFFFFLIPQGCQELSSQIREGSNSCSLKWKSRVLTIVLPGNSPNRFFHLFIIMPLLDLFFSFLKIYFIFFFLLEHNCFTIWCQFFFLYSKLNQLCVYIYIPILSLPYAIHPYPTHLGHHRAPS